MIQCQEYEFILMKNIEIVVYLFISTFIFCLIFLSSFIFYTTVHIQIIMIMYTQCIQNECIPYTLHFHIHLLSVMNSLEAD